MNDTNLNPNGNLFQNILEINQISLIKAYELQNRQNYEESANILEKIYKNFHILGSIADQIPATQYIIKENREILSAAHLDKLNKEENCRLNNQYNYEKKEIKVGGKKKQQKLKWSNEEQSLFLEGIELHGIKNIKKITEHVKTRTINQVRSHLQKHQIKLSKQNPNSDNNGN